MVDKRHHHLRHAHKFRVADTQRCGVMVAACQGPHGSHRLSSAHLHSQPWLSHPTCCQALHSLHCHLPCMLHRQQVSSYQADYHADNIISRLLHTSSSTVRGSRAAGSSRRSLRRPLMIMYSDSAASPCLQRYFQCSMQYSHIKHGDS